MRIIENPRVICSNELSPFNYFAWPTVCRLPDGVLAAACSGFRLRHVCPFGKAVVFYSRDEGKSWSAPTPVIDTPLDDRDSGLCVLGNRVILTSFNNSVAFQRTHLTKYLEKHEKNADTDLMSAYFDCVAEDAEAKYLGSTYKISTDGGYTFGDTVRRSPVTSPHGPCVTPDGRVLWIGRSFDTPKGDQLLCCELDENNNFNVISSIPDASDEFGTLFSCEPHALCLPDGKIIVHIRIQRGGEQRLFTVYQSESSDGGYSFSVPHPLLDKLGGSPPHLIRHSSGTLVSVYASREKPYGIRAMTSPDMGVSWRTGLVLTDDAPNGDLGYPSSVELYDGRILTVYYENRSHAVIRQLVWEL